MSPENKTQRKIEKILKKKRGYIFEVPQNESVIFMMSGGIDSSILAELCINNWGNIIYPFYVLRGATAEKYEIAAVRKVLKYLKNKYPHAVKKLFTLEFSIPPKNIKNNLSRERVTEKGHPLRNCVMQNLAVQYGAMLNDLGTEVRSVLAGSVDSDFFAGSQLIDFRINTLYTCSNLGEWKWQITSPALEKELIKGYSSLKKLDLIQWGLKNNFPFEITRTCTHGGDFPCGKCGECKERIDTFKKVDLKDPLTYT